MKKLNYQQKKKTYFSKKSLIPPSLPVDLLLTDGISNVAASARECGTVVVVQFAGIYKSLLLYLCSTLRSTCVCVSTELTHLEWWCYFMQMTQHICNAWAANTHTVVRLMNFKWWEAPAGLKLRWHMVQRRLCECVCVWVLWKLLISDSSPGRILHFKRAFPSSSMDIILKQTLVRH